jgi:imidazolonepropionase-like amidohydrolase
MRRMCSALWCAAIVLAALAPACRAPSAAISASPVSSADIARRGSVGRTYAYTNGRWLRNGRFESGTMYAVDGVFRATQPSHVDSTIDLGGGYAIPPFGDAHSHSLGAPALLDTMRKAYLAEGTFYVQVLTNRRSSTDLVRARFNTPCALDVVYANGALTSTLGHPFEIQESKAMGRFDLRAAMTSGVEEVKRSRVAEGDGYWLIDSVADLERQWPAILAGKPDVVKVFLVFAEDSAVRRQLDAVPAAWYYHGMSAATVRAVVQRAHAAGLRVVAHVESARDLQIAAESGVDVAAHMPGASPLAGLDSVYRVSDDLAALVAARGMIVIPTAVLARESTAPDRLAAVRVLERENLRRLKAHGVRMVIGRDSYAATAREEFLWLAGLGVWDTPSLIALWSEATPRSIFPGRAIGRLDDGYEASFLVLRSSPLENLRAVEDITLRVKQGCVLN